MKELGIIGHVGAGKTTLIEHVIPHEQEVVVTGFEPEPIVIKNYRANLGEIPSLIEFGPMPPKPKHRNGKANRPNRKFQKKQKKARKNNRQKRK